MGPFKSLFNKLLGFLLLCLVCSGVVAVVLIRGQMTQLAYEQMRLLFESDFRNVRTFLQGKADWLLAVAHDLAKDELLKTGLELEVFDQVRNIAESRKTALGLSEVMVINAQKRLVSRGDARRDMLDPQVDADLVDRAFGGIEFGGRYQVFGQTTLSTPDGKLLARVVVMQPLSAAFFQELKAVLGKDAMVFAGTREVGSTFAQPPGPLQLTPVAPQLFMAFDRKFIGTERDLGDVVGHVGWQVVLLETAAPLLRSLRQVEWGTVLFVLLFMSLMALVSGCSLPPTFAARNAGHPAGHCGAHAGQSGHAPAPGPTDEWRLIEEALNQLSTSLAQNAQLQNHHLSARRLAAMSQRKWWRNCSMPPRASNAATTAVLTDIHQLTVAPKGIAAPLTLYAVSGIAGTHHLSLPTPTETLVSLPQALDVRYTVLEGKFAAASCLAGV